MDSVVVGALGTGVSATTFLVGFSSVRMRAQRDRALARADFIATELMRAAAANRPVDDAEVEAAARAFEEADEPDPIGRWTVIVSWTVVLLMVALIFLYRTVSAPWWVFSPTTWGSGTYATLFLLLMGAVVAGLGSADYWWVGRDLRKHLSASVIGLATSAINSRRAGNDDVALSTSDKLIERAPTWPWAHAFRAHVLNRLQKRPMGLAALDRAVDLDPQNPWWRIARAEMYLVDENYKKALDDLEGLEERLPQQAHIYRILGAALYGVGRRADSIDAFDHALALDPLSADTRMDRGKALVSTTSVGNRETPSGALIDMLVDEGSTVALEAISSVGVARLNARDAAAAVDDFTFVIENDPGNAGAYSWRAVARIESGDESGLTADIETAIALGARPAMVYRRLGNAWNRIGRLLEADAAFTRSLDAQERATTYFDRGITRARLDRNADALLDFESALRLDPGHSRARIHRAALLMELGRDAEADDEFAEIETAGTPSVHDYAIWTESLMVAGRISDATEVLERGVEACRSEENFADLLAIRGSLHVRQRMFRRALDDFAAAEENGCPAAEVAFRRALCLKAMGDSDAALAAIREAAETRWGFQFGALATRSTMHRARGEMEAALADMNRAIDLAPGVASLYVARGCQMYAFDGDRDRAMADYRRALEIDPRETSALMHRLRIWEPETEDAEALADLSLLENIVGRESQKAAEARARYFEQRRMFEQQAVELRRLLEIDSDDQGALWSLGACCDNAGDFEDAEVIFKQLAARDPGNLSARLGLAVAISQQARSEEAVAAFREAWRAEPLKSEVWMSTNLRADLLPRYGTVMRDWARATSVQDDSADSVDP